jgi:hypothetical protein
LKPVMLNSIKLAGGCGAPSDPICLEGIFLLCAAICAWNLLMTAAPPPLHS